MPSTSDRQGSTDTAYSHEKPDKRRRHHRRRGRDREEDRERRQDSYESESERRRRHRERDERRRDRYDTLDSTNSGREDKDRPRRRQDRKDRGRHRDGSVESPVPLVDDPFDTPPPYETTKTTNVYAKHRREKQSSRDKYNEKDTSHLTASQVPDEEIGESGSTEVQDGDKSLTKLERFGGPWIYAISILTAYCLLAAATCSSDWWRKDVNVVRVGLPSDVYGRMLATGKNLGKTGGEEVKQDLRERAAKVVPEGWLSVGFWGWCISTDGDGQYACSETDAWYAMDELLETASVTTTIPPDAYFVGLIHGIVVHGLAIIAAMSASVPAGILIWRRYIRNNKVVHPGLALHGTMFAGATFSFIAYIIDKTLEARLRKQIKYPVEQGSVPIMAGVAALLLFLALLASTAPGVYRRVRRQREYAGAWEDVHEAEFEKEPMTAKGIRRGRTWKRKMKRMTGFYGHDDEDRTTRRHRGRGRRR